MTDADSRRPIATLLSAWPEPAALLGADGAIRATGHAAQAQLGWSAGELRGRMFADLLVPDDQRARLPGRVRGEPDERRGVESRVGITFRRRDGSTFVGEVLVADVRDGEDAGLLVLVRPDAAVLERDLFETVFRHAPDMITVVHPETGQRLANAAVQRILGHDANLFADHADLVHEDDLDRVRREITPRDGFGGPVRYRARTASGEWRWLESTCADLREVPPVGGLLVFTRDVSAEVAAVEQLAASRTRLAALVTGLNAGILVEDETREVVTANGALFEMFRLEGAPPDVVSRPAAPLLERLAAHTDDPVAFLDIAGRLAARDAQGVAEFGLVDGRTVELDATPIRGTTGGLGRLWAFRDVSARVAEEVRRRRIVALEKEARANAERQADSLLELDRIRSQLVAAVSHELRTPLTPIASHVEMLLQGHPEPISAGQRDSLEAIGRNVDRLRRLVDDLLTVRNAEQGTLRIRPEPVDVAALMRRQVEQFRPYAERIGVGLTCAAEPGPAAPADPDRLGIVIDNLLANALKFTPPGGHVALDARRAEASWEIRVTDDGRGIRPQDLPNLFEPFFRTADAEHDGLPGSGLGLAVARALAEGHGGGISVTSRPGAGTTFLVRIPVGGA